MSKFYEESIIPKELRRNFDVYDRIRELKIDLGKREEQVTSLAGLNIARVVFLESGLVFLSGVPRGKLPMSDDEDTLKHGEEAGQAAADEHIRRLHWAVSCGGEGGDLNDLLYTVKGLGMVVSPSGDGFGKAPRVVNGYSNRWHSVFGGSCGEYAQGGIDPGGFAGVHTRTAIGGFGGKFSLEPEMIVALPGSLAKAIISNRGWVFPLPPQIQERINKTQGR